MLQKRTTRSNSNKSQNASKKTLFDHFSSSQKSLKALADDSSVTVCEPLQQTTQLTTQPIEPVAGFIDEPGSSANGTVVTEGVDIAEVPLVSPIDPAQIIPPARKKRTRKAHADPSKPVFPIFAKSAGPSMTTPTFSNSITTSAEVLDITNDIPSSPIMVVESTVRSGPHEGTTKYNPIVLEPSPSPVKDLRNVHHGCRAGPPIASLFATKPKHTVDKPPLPLWPDRESQHVQGSQTIFSTPISNITKHKQEEPSPSASVPWVHSSAVAEPPSEGLSVAEEALSHKDRTSFVSTLPASDLSHPAIRKILHSTELARNEQEDWTQRWRPTRAAEVLGNSHHAIYLRDWLRTLELQLRAKSMPPSPVKKTSHPDGFTLRGALKRKEPSKNPKRPQVIRAVVRPRGRKRRKTDFDDEDTWIVHTDDEEDEVIEETDYDDQDFLGYNTEEPPAPPESQAESLASDYESEPQEEFDFSEYLTNTILLCGPPGSGKTASVYACAAELDWEIFEVFSGGGKRNGASIENMVGDVGKNHIVQLQRRIAKQSCTTTTHPVNSSLVDCLEAQGLPLKTAEVRQSAILLEEVDILFKDDINFWPSVVALVKECRRPVILTCSDYSLVPVGELPLQTVLTFDPCPTGLATSFLQCMAWVEGHTLDRDSVKELYAMRYSLNPFDMPDAPLHPLHSPLPCPDLRRTIHQLQWQCATSNGKPPLRGCLSTLVGDFYSRTAEAETTAVLPRLLPGEKLSRHRIEDISWLDSYGIRDPARSAWGLSLDDHGVLSDNDDVVGRTILKDPSAGAEVSSAVYALYDQDIEIANRAIALTCGVSSLLDSETACRMFLDRAEYQNEILKVLEDVLDVGGPLMPRGVVFSDYEAWLRLIVAADDVNERDETRQYHSRRTRNRTVYARTLALKEESLETVRRTGLRIV